MAKLVINVQANGDIKFIYADALKALLGLGDAQIERASHVEPTAGNQWEADMSPVGGPRLGPFDTRQAALDAEVVWINRNVLAAAAQ